ncbi:MAG: hypothetical protein FJ150_05745 [Euryarchaeota archaeon]|nr:hypothetical protein [Euryarchaeota archaeon]
MKDKFLVLVLITLVVFLSGCFQQDINKINEIAPTINDHIKKGDELFNKSANDTNRYSYENALLNCDQSASEFNLAKSSAQEALAYAKNSNETVYIDYIGYVINEIDAKLNATSELKIAIQLFKENNTDTANTHVDAANEFMRNAMEYKNKRAEIVRQNPSKFKES